MLSLTYDIKCLKCLKNFRDFLGISCKIILSYIFSRSPQRGSSCVLLQKVLQPAMIQRRTRSASTKGAKIYSSIVRLRKKVLGYAVSFPCLNRSANLSTQACVLILSLSSHQTTRYLTTSGWHTSSHHIACQEGNQEVFTSLILPSLQTVVLLCLFTSICPQKSRYDRLKREDSETNFAKLSVEYC